MQEILRMFSYPFMVRALVCGGLIALCSALLGVNLVLKRFSMIGDGLSHVGFGAMAISACIGIAPLYVAIPVVVVCAFLLLRVGNSSKIKGDAAVALISTGALAVGIMAVSLCGGMNVDIMNYMFGSILAVGEGDVLPVVIFSLIVIIFYILSYNRLFCVTFDEDFARASGINVGRMNGLIAVFTAVTIVLGMKLLGALLISSLIIFPPLCAMRLFKSYKGVTVCSCVLSVVCFFLGITASYFLSTPAGASVVSVNIIVFLACLVIERIKK